MGGGPPCFTPGFTCPVLLWCHFTLSSISSTGLLPSSAVLSGTIPLYLISALLWSSTPYFRMVWALSFSLAATWEIDFSFSSSGYLDVSVHRVSSYVTILFITWYMSITSCGFPHSEICGSTAVCASPQLFAACHVLLRLLLPRHPPYALSCLTYLSLFFVEKLLHFLGISSFLAFFSFFASCLFSLIEIVVNTLACFFLFGS